MELPGLAAAGTLLVTGMVHFSGADTSPYAFLYLWVALYALYFFTATRAAMHIIFIAIAYAGVLALDLTAGQHLELAVDRVRRGGPEVELHRPARWSWRSPS